VQAATDDRLLFHRASNWSGLSELETITSADLRALTAAHGIDFATAVLYDRLRRSETHGAYIARIEAALEEPAPRHHLRGVTFAIAPGAFWREMPHIDADGRLLRSVAEAMGCRTALIPVPSTGALRDNARQILNWLRQAGDGPIILCSLSKGSADVRLAMEAEPAAFHSVRAWINVCGLVTGTPLADYLLGRRWHATLVKLLFWFRGFEFQMIRDLRHGPPGPLAGPFHVPRHIAVRSVVAYPLERHIVNRRTRRWRRPLARHGPNDGGMLLHDVTALPGLVYPVWGADHRLQPPGVDLRPLAASLLLEVAESVLTKENGQLSQPELGCVLEVL